MEKEINIAEILKDCQKGEELYSPLYGNVCFEGIEDGLPFPIKATDRLFGIKRVLWFDEYGRVNIGENKPSKETFLFPSKDQRDWSKFVRPVVPPFDIKRVDKGEKYFSCDSQLERFLAEEVHDAADDNRWNGGNYFNTRKQAEYAAGKVKELLLSMRKEVSNE